MILPGADGPGVEPFESRYTPAPSATAGLLTNLLSAAGRQ